MKKLILNNFQKLMSMMLTVILFLSTISFEVFATDPKVSIIIPVYNTPQNLLRDCLESAKNQTLKDIEIICVDDGSTDGSGKILDEYAKNDPRFVVIHQENGRLSVARNKGLEAAKGEYIQFLDSDDTIDPTTSEKCYNKAKECDTDIIRFGYTAFDLQKNRKIRDVCFKFMIYDRNILKNFEIFTKMACQPVVMCLYRSEFIKKNNVKFFEGVNYYGDEFFNLLLIPRANKMVTLPHNLYTYNVRHNSDCHTKRPREYYLKNITLAVDAFYEATKNFDYFKDTVAKKNFLIVLLNRPDFGILRKNFNNISLKKIWHGLLQNDVINKLSLKEKIKLKLITMPHSNPQTNPEKTIEDGTYIISSKLDPNKCLDIHGGSKSDKANLQLWQKNGTNAQKFKIQYNSDGYYTIEAMYSGKFIDVSTSGKQNGTNIWQYSGNGTDAQKWFIVPDGEGYYCLVSKCNNMCMDVYGAKAINGANIHCWSVHGGDNQRFNLEKCEDKPSEVKKDAGNHSANKQVEAEKPA